VMLSMGDAMIARGARSAVRMRGMCMLCIANVRYGEEFVV
jgi:hypothetical protein